MPKIKMIILITLSSFFSATKVSYACVAPPPPSLCEILPDSICEVFVDTTENKPLPGGQNYEVIISSFVTFGSRKGESCGIALGEFNIGRLVGAKIQKLDGSLINGFNFKTNKYTAPSLKLSSISKHGKFKSGVSGTLTKSIPVGEWVKLKLEIETSSEVPKDKLVKAMRNAIFATGATNKHGEFSGEHLEVMRLDMMSKENKNHKKK